MKTQLEIGDKIYSFYRQRITGYSTINRVTKTQAITHTNKFRRDLSRGIRVVGDTWGVRWYSLATPELDERWENTLIRDKLSTVDFSELDIEKIKRIMKIVKE